MSTPWDEIKPNLSKLPIHIREALSEPTPLQPNEVHGKLLIQRRKEGLNHPNARIRVSKLIKTEHGQQIPQLSLEFCTHRGLALVMSTIDKENLRAFSKAVIQVLRDCDALDEDPSE